MASSADDQLLHKSMREFTAALVHTKTLLRTRNRLRSPLLQLPAEILVHILSFIMDELNSSPHHLSWLPIYSTCHQIHHTMRTATDLWWKVDCADCASANFMFNRSNGAPRVLLADFRLERDRRPFHIECLLGTWRDNLKFRGHRIHTLEFCGHLSNLPSFSWIFERSLPRLQCLRVNIVQEDSVEPLPVPVPLELPMGIPLRVLDLQNATLPWSSLTGLRQLHLSFTGCHPIVTIPEDELFAIFDASPQLERLSLLKVGHEFPVSNGRPLPPKRIIRFPNLTSLKLDNTPTVVMYTLAYMELPAIDSLHIRSFIDSGLTQTPVSLFFPDARLPLRLFSDPPIFAVGSSTPEEQDHSVGVCIGSFSLSLDFPPNEAEFGMEAVMSHITQLAPPSITRFDVDYTHLEEREWRDFFRSHPQVRSIRCTSYWEVARSFWDALSPAGENSVVLCPRLESISVFSDWITSFLPLVDCLRTRQNSGSKLKLLTVVNQTGLPFDEDGFPEAFYPFVETVQFRMGPDSELREVSPVRIREPGVCADCLPSGTWKVVG